MNDRDCLRCEYYKWLEDKSLSDGGYYMCCKWKCKYEVKDEPIL